MITTAIPDAMLLPTDECFAKEVPEPVYDGLTQHVPNMLYGIKIRAYGWPRNKSRLRFGGRPLLLLNDEARRCHPYIQAL